LELLKANVQFYVDAAFAMTAATAYIDADGTIPENAYISLQKNVSRLRDECADVGLTVTWAFLDALSESLEGNAARGDPKSIGLGARLLHIQEVLKTELSQHLFLEVPKNREKLFDNPRIGWEEVIAVFPDAVVDIEEMSKCFALARYAGSVFHSVLVIEHGLIKLGTFIGVEDPKSGWTAVSNRLNSIVNTGHDKRSDFQRANFPFIEQAHGTVAALKNAWRNKISHAQGRLIVLASEFTPDTAEEIMMATRGFMRKLAVEMPRAQQ
jgi:hypothetical protein